jgi:hypothetical protein
MLLSLGSADSRSNRFLPELYLYIRSPAMVG